MVRRLVDAWNRRDIEALLDLGGPEIAFVNSPTAVEPGTRRGTHEVVAAVRKQWEFLDARWEVDEFFDRGDEIFALGRLSRGMPGSDTQLEMGCEFLIGEAELRRRRLIGHERRGPLLYAASAVH